MDELGRLAAREILELIKQMPDLYRDVLMIKVQERCTDKELASSLGCSRATARKRLERARMILLEKMNERNELHEKARV